MLRLHAVAVSWHFPAGRRLLALWRAYTVDPTEPVISRSSGNRGANRSRSRAALQDPVRPGGEPPPEAILPWDGQTNEMPTKDKLYIRVDTFGRWRIVDPLEYFRRMRDDAVRLSRLEDILGSETRNAVAKHDLIEIVRTDRSPAR